MEDILYIFKSYKKIFVLITQLPVINKINGAGDETRTRDSLLGRQKL